uniref:Calmodulin-lysine N-methyltransferase n=1 Tax=Bicosoecida sp. CB-2014 TaxID=1486930 RepID=A0A7S1CKZ4_9STRA|mmetsp:Transcript_27695/g.95830  ORF Transcript_27695/g.95830 Transcript_27695/m.95830 type:complete len:275 (+) Transcript_27695:273-1097(+)
MSGVAARRGPGDDVRVNSDSTTAVVVEVGSGAASFRLAQQPASGDHGLCVWDASIAVAHYLFHHVKAFNPRKLKGKRGIDVGAGCGLSGLALARLGCDVVLTDLPQVLSQLRRNAQMNAASDDANAGSVSVAELRWGDDPSHLKPPFDFVTASDVVFSDDAVRPLLECLASLCGPRTLCLVANELRDLETDALFLREAATMFRVKKVPHSKLSPDFRPETILLYELRKRADAPTPMTRDRDRDGAATGASEAASPEAGAVGGAGGAAGSPGGLT